MPNVNVNTPVTPDFISFRDISKRITVSEKTLRNKASQGKLPFPCLLVMSKRVVRVSDFDAYLASLVADIVPSSPQNAPQTPLKPPSVDCAKKKIGRPTNASKAAEKAAAELARDPHPHTVDLVSVGTDAEVHHA